MLRYAFMSALVMAAIMLVPSGHARSADELVVYSGRKENAIKPVVEAFQKQTGIAVRLKTGPTSGLANEIIQEKTRPLGDVFIATEVGVMEILSKKDVLEPYFSPAGRDLGPGLRATHGRWTGISSRARVLIYNRNLVADKDVPRSVFQLTDPKWKGKIAIASTRERTTLSWVASLVALKGRDGTKDYLTRLIANGLTILPDNTEVWQGVGRGEFALGLTNSPNYFLARKANYPVGVVYPDQEDGGLGTLLNLNAAAVIKGGPNPDAAKRFIDFLLAPEGQRILIDGAYEIPLRPDIIDSSPLTGFQRMAVTELQLAELEEPTLKLLADMSPRW